MSSSSREARRRSRKPSMETTVERIVIMPATVGRWRKNLQPFSVFRSFEQAQGARNWNFRFIVSAEDAIEYEVSATTHTHPHRHEAPAEPVLAHRAPETQPDSQKLPIINDYGGRNIWR